MREHPDTLKIGIMSFAHPHAQTYASVLAGYDDVEVAAADPDAHEPDEKRGVELANELGIAYFPTYESLLSWGPDAVIVTSENSKHRGLVELAVQAGCDILCEKPLATTVEDAQAIRSAVKAGGVFLMMAFPVRYSSTFAQLKQAHDDGELGEILSISGANNGKLPSERSWFTEPEMSGGGALVDHVVHIADLADELMGVEAVSATAITNKVLHPSRARAETGGLITVRYENGVILAIDCSWSQPDTAPTWGGLTLSVRGTNGSVDLDFFGPRVRGISAETGVPFELPYGSDLDDQMLRTFVNSVRSGVLLGPGLEVGLRTLQLVLASQESTRTGTTVAITTG